MKKFLAVGLALAMMVTMGVVAFAETKEEASHCSPDPSVAEGGDKVKIYTSDFYWRDKDAESDDDEYESMGWELDKEYNSLLEPTWKKCGSYVDRVYFEDGDDYVTLVIKSGIKISTEKEIRGTLRIRDKDSKRTYTCTIGEDDLSIGINDTKSEMYQDGDRKYSLPYDYQESKVKFVTEDGDDYGTFTADFDNDKGTKIAK